MCAECTRSPYQCTVCSEANKVWDSTEEWCVCDEGYYQDNAGLCQAIVLPGCPIGEYNSNPNDDEDPVCASCLNSSCPYCYDAVDELEDPEAVAGVCYECGANTVNSDCGCPIDLYMDTSDFLCKSCEEGCVNCGSGG